METLYEGFGAEAKATNLQQLEAEAKATNFQWLEAEVKGNVEAEVKGIVEAPYSKKLVEGETNSNISEPNKADSFGIFYNFKMFLKI